MCDLLHRQILGLEVRPIGTPGSVCEVEDVPLSNTPSL